MIRPDDPPIRAAINDFINRLSAAGYPLIFIHFLDEAGQGGATITVPEHAAIVSPTIARLVDTVHATSKVIPGGGRFNSKQRPTN